MMKHQLVFRASASLAVGFVASGALGQSLFLEVAETPIAGVEVDLAEPLYAYSLVAVRPPEPREILPQDLVTIIIRETSSVIKDQTLETRKRHSLDVEALRLQALLQFIELRGPNSSETQVGNPALETENRFRSEGEYERNDDVTARVTARVLEVKPNGTVLLEARTSVQTDEEVQTITLSGYCRTEDIGESNVVQSSELYDLQLNVQHEGEVRKATKKGLIPNIFETLFNF